jgi:glycosyltransferase involved in cell wall biosynthesis
MRKRGLLIIPRTPFPVNSGGRMAIFNTIKSLSEEFDLDLIIIDDVISNDKYLIEFSKYSKNIKFFGHKKHLHIMQAFRGFLKGLPLQVGYFHFYKVQKYIDSIIHNYDFAYCFMIRTTNYLKNHDIVKVQYAIDSMYLNYRNSLKLTKSFFWKLIYKIEIPRLYRYEKFIIKNFNLNNFVNFDESNFWSNHGNAFSIPHGITIENLSYSKIDYDYKDSIVFLGRMDYQPNIEAVLWFCDNILKQINPNITFLIIGGYPTKVILNLQKKYTNVKVLGFIDDIKIILKSCLCSVAPMRSGGGLQTKIIEAMSLGTIVISTNLSSKSIIGVVNNKNILIEDNPELIAKLVNNIYFNPNDYVNVKLEAKKVIMANYINDNISDEIIRQINNII